MDILPFTYFLYFPDTYSLFRITKKTIEGISFSRRLCARYIRLNIPIIIAVLCAYILLRLNLYSNIPAAELSGSTQWLNTFYIQPPIFSNAIIEALFGSIFLGYASFVPPLWTITLEFAGSALIFSYTFIKFKNKQTRYISLGIVYLIIAFNFPSKALYILAFIFGMLIHTQQRKTYGNLLLAFIGCYFGAFQYNTPFYSMFNSLNFSTSMPLKDIFNIIGATLVVLAIRNGFLKTLLEGYLFQFLGKISYSLYITHFMVLCTFSTSIYIASAKNMAMLVSNFIFYISLCITLGFLFEKYVDQTAIKLARTLLKGREK